MGNYANSSGQWLCGRCNSPVGSVHAVCPYCRQEDVMQKLSEQQQENADRVAYGAQEAREYQESLYERREALRKIENIKQTMFVGGAKNSIVEIMELISDPDSASLESRLNQYFTSNKSIHEILRAEFILGDAIDGDGFVSRMNEYFLDFIIRIPNFAREYRLAQQCFLSFVEQQKFQYIEAQNQIKRAEQELAHEQLRLEKARKSSLGYKAQKLTNVIFYGAIVAMLFGFIGGCFGGFFLSIVTGKTLFESFKIAGVVSAGISFIAFYLISKED